MSTSPPNLPPDLHTDDDARAIEAAIRAAVATVMKVMSGACTRRLQEYQKMVADRDREIRRLESRLEERDSELEELRLRARRTQRCALTCGSGESAGGEQQSSCSGEYLVWEQKVSPPTCFSLSVICSSVGAAAPTQLSSRSRGAAALFPRQHAQTETASPEAPGFTPSAIKEEPCDMDTVIKWEVCEGTLLDPLEAPQEEELLRKDMQPECVVKNANPHLSKLLEPEPQHEDQTAAHLKRKGGGNCPPAAGDNEGVRKKPFIHHLPSTPAPAGKDSLGSGGPPEPLKQSSDGSADIGSQEPLMFQQQALISMAAPPTTCDPILLEVLVSLETIKQQNSTVLKILQSGSSSAALHSEPPDVGALPLPLQSVTDLRSLEHRLSTEPELKKKMISYLGLSGGMTTKESVWRIMAKLFTNTLAKNVNWRGRNNKQKIESLTIKKVVLNAVRQNSFCKDAVDEEIERYMKRWLQLAGDRDGGRKRRQEKGKEAMAGMMRNYCVSEMFASVIE